MPLYQNSSVNSEKLILGNCKVEVAASDGATYVNLGAGMVNSFTHEPTMYDSQAGNAPAPIKGVADEVIRLDVEMIEYDASVMNTIWGGLFTMSVSSSVQTIHAGGEADSTVSERAFRCTNTRYDSNSSTVETILIVYFGTPDQGPSFTFKSDNDTDPIAVMPLAVTGTPDTTRAAGQQLYKITHDVAV
tara:strand:+ start:952 stop:1518 length:567 start_codon:yes stop_codon:yes gene_type:complete